MNYTSHYINKLNNGNNFNNSNLEKVLRLLDVLQFITNELDPSGEKLVLKGGTAINLIYTNLARLSVDIDLDYVGSIDKVKTRQDRINIIAALDEYMEDNGYVISNKSRGSVILESRNYSYINSYGNRDNIKVEINFIDRIHIGPTIQKKINYFGKELIVNTCIEEELFAMKICALIDRSKVRDLFDTNILKEHVPSLNDELLRKITIFYMSLDGIYKLDENTFDILESISFYNVKTELIQVLPKNSKFNLDKVKTDVSSFLKKLLFLNENEKIYLEEFSKGNYKPELLFNDPYFERANLHPMAKWREMQNKNY